MEFIITDREGIEKGVRVESPYVVISIHDPDKRPARIRRQQEFRASLVLAFNDAEEVPGLPLPCEVVLMSRNQANKIRRFIEEHRENVGTVVVHCEAGMSRSPAVAAALCRAFDQDDKPLWQEYQPNRHVYRLLLDVFECSGRNDI